MSNFKVEYPRAELKPTDNPNKLIGWREKNGGMQPIGVEISESQPVISGNTETVILKITTTVITTFNP